ncbi:unnamed protein product [Clonostachys byssicola]|uniref:Ubiquitin fusion degradation protein n=1 Tax=Clonostachys byssicola TaxID=160290 RepID=A0A9N9UC11_9HYPO|nr:unnamed protein product [Clonostachys byssicola]
MSEANVVHRTRSETHVLTSSTTPLLLDTLVNPLILDNTVPYLPVSSLLNLALASKAFRYLLYNTPRVFRHLDLTRVKTARFDVDKRDQGQTWHNVELDDYLTEDDFYSGPLRGVFSTLKRRDLLRDVQTLVLDGLSVTAELCNDIINDPTYSVRILSIRDVKNLNHGKLRGALQYACRGSRPEGAPRLKALYVFGAKDSSLPDHPSANSSSISAEWNQKSQHALTTSLKHEGDAWWSKRGRMISRPIPEDWANCLLACEGIIAFDAVLCQGPRHRSSPVFGTTPLRAMCGPAVATYAVPPCAGCGKCPEGPTVPSLDFTRQAVPLLAPPPLVSSSVRAATTPRGPAMAFVPRCVDCLRERYCLSCNKWWCEACYTVPGSNRPGGADSVVIVDEDGSVASFAIEPEFLNAKAKARVSRSCWECGMNCDSCISKTQKSCRKCCSGYCLVHNEGSCTKFGASRADGD